MESDFMIRFYFIILLNLIVLIDFSLATSSPTAGDRNINDGVLDRLMRLESEFRNQNLKISDIALENRNQNEELRGMKESIHQMKNEWNNQIFSEDDKNGIRQKRPVRLLPAHLFRPKDENRTNDEAIQVPSSCSELSQLGHTLNGIYLVKPNIFGNKMDALYCNFKPSGFWSGASVTQERLGIVDIISSKSTSSGVVHFYIYGWAEPLKIGFNSDEKLVRFKIEQLNIGKAMNVTTGVFTVPINGTYHFSFSGHKDGGSYSTLAIYLRLNGINMGMAFGSRGFSPTSISFQSTLKLKRGDLIDLWTNSGALDNCHNCNHFTGSLLEKDI